MESVGINREQFNEIRVSARHDSWTTEVALIPGGEYPEGAWALVDKGKDGQCKLKREDMMILRMANMGVQSLVKRMESEGMDPSLMSLTLHVTDIGVAECLRGQRSEMAMARTVALVKRTAKPFRNFAVYLLATDRSPHIDPSKAR